jgi:hypothetical protein
MLSYDTIRLLQLATKMLKQDVKRKRREAGYKR